MVTIEVHQALADNLKLWEDIGIPAPRNELQSIKAWLLTLQEKGKEETIKCMRMRMILLATTANAIHAVDAADDFGIYENAEELRPNE